MFAGLLADRVISSKAASTSKRGLVSSAFVTDKLCAGLPKITNPSLEWGTTRGGATLQHRRIKKQATATPFAFFCIRPMRDSDMDETNILITVTLVVSRGTSLLTRWGMRA